MITISQSYLILKKESREEFARKTLLENLLFNKGKIKKTAKKMKSSRNPIYLALEKEREQDLTDKLHILKNCSSQNYLPGNH